MGDNPLLLEWHGSSTVSRSVCRELVEGFLEGISRLLGSGGAKRASQSGWLVLVLTSLFHNCND